MNIKTILMILGLCHVACQEVEQQDSPVFSGLMGSWQGIIKNLSADGDQVIDISLSLDANRRFTLQKTRSKQKAVGTYDDFPQLNSLTLRVKESDALDLAEAGGILDFEYELYEGELLLNSRSSLLRLKRPEAGGENELNMLWVCSQGETAWQLSFVGNQFLLYSENEGGASIFIKGKFNPEPLEEDENEQRVAMFVEDAQPVKLFSQLNGVLVYEQEAISAINLTPFALDGRQLAALSCSLPQQN